MMQDLLRTYYAIDVQETSKIDDTTAYISDEYVYLTTTASNKEVIHMEQASLAYHLVEKGYDQVAYPIQNNQTQWMTEAYGNRYIVMRVKNLKTELDSSHGKTLAVFHYVNRSYAFQPQYISSYGQWKALWTQKLIYFEEKILKHAKAEPNQYYQLLMDSLPYLVGISENAIQYMQESEREQRYDDGDSGTVTFQRYQVDHLESVILPDYLVYDHRSRDLAEYLRTQFLDDEQSDLAIENLKHFLSDYEQVYPLSPLSWRLLYARLIFPVHLFDFVEKTFNTKVDKNKYLELDLLLKKQERYSQRVNQLFKEVNERLGYLEIPLIPWL